MEKMRRTSIEIPWELHRRIRIKCAEDNIAFTVALAQLLEQAYPAPRKAGLKKQEEQPTA